MKTPKRYTFVFILAFALACTNNRQQFQTMQVFEGTWQQENTNTFEIWEKHKNLFSAQVIKIENADTLIVEKLRIFQDDNVIYYEATVPNQNKGEAIRFKLTRQNGKRFQFENPEHDFPQKIVYTFQNKTQLKAIISGGNKQAVFNYKKVK